MKRMYIKEKTKDEERETDTYRQREESRLCSSLPSRDPLSRSLQQLYNEEEEEEENMRSASLLLLFLILRTSK